MTTLLKVGTEEISNCLSIFFQVKAAISVGDIGDVEEEMKDVLDPSLQSLIVIETDLRLSIFVSGSITFQPNSVDLSLKSVSLLNDSLEEIIANISVVNKALRFKGTYTRETRDMFIHLDMALHALRNALMQTTKYKAKLMLISTVYEKGED